jgi:hypothetical protein
MPIDVITLAGTAVTAFLVPYLKDAAGAFTKKVAEKLGEDAAKQAGEAAPKLWERVKSIFSADDEITTLGLFEKKPELHQTAVKEILAEKLKEDDKLAEEFDKIINQQTQNGQSIGAQIMGAMYASILDARGANFAGAKDVNLVGMSINPNPTKPSPPGPPVDPSKKSE